MSLIPEADSPGARVAMTRYPLRSSMFIAASYCATSRALELELHHGAIYLVHDVSPCLVQAFLSAPSKGRFYQRWIQDLFELELVRDLGGRRCRRAAAPTHVSTTAAA